VGWNKEDKMNLEQLIKACVEARKEYELGEVKYFEFLLQVEQKNENVWKPACGTFDSFLEKYVGSPRPSRYAEFRAAFDKLGAQVVRTLGVDGALIALKASSTTKQKEYSKAAHDWVAMHDGVHPSREEAGKLLKQVDPRTEVPRAVGQVKELEELRAERDELKRKCHMLTRENEKLRAENARLLAKRPGKPQPQPRA
jgi:hypothetical protein